MTCPNCIQMKLELEMVREQNRLLMKQLASVGDSPQVVVTTKEEIERMRNGDER